MKYNGNVKVVDKKFLKDDIYKLVVEKPKNIQIKAGQFFMIKSVGEYPLLNRPVSVSGHSEETIEFSIKIVGRETAKMSELVKDDEIYLLGPSGNGFDIKERHEKVLLVGGGIGIEPLKSAALELNNKDIFHNAFLGFKNESFDIDEFEYFVDNVVVFSEEDKTADFVGYPTDRLDEELKKGNYSAVFTCGPEILMNKVKSICEENNIEVQMLLEEKMACGIGACLGCTCDTKDGYKKVCVDGPMFYGSEVK